MTTAIPIKTSSQLTTALSLKEVKARLGLPLDQCVHDAELKSLINLAIQQIEHDTSYAIRQATYDWRPLSLAHRTPMPHHNANDVSEVKYTDKEDVEQTLDPGSYNLDIYKDRPDLVLDLTNIPETSETAPYPWMITYQAGPASNQNIPEWMVQSCISLVQHNWSGGIDAEQKSRLGAAYEALTRRQYSTYL